MKICDVKLKSFHGVNAIRKRHFHLKVSGDNTDFRGN